MSDISSYLDPAPSAPPSRFQGDEPPKRQSLDDMVKPKESLTAGLAAVERGKMAADDKVYSSMERTLDDDQTRMRKAFDQTGISPDTIRPWNEQEQSRKFDHDPIEKFTSLGSVFGLVASAFTHAPMANGLNASAAAMKAIQAGDDKAYDRAHEAWKENMDLAMKRHTIMREAYQDATSLMQSNMAAGQAKLQIAAAKFGDQKMLYLLEHGMSKEIFELQASRDKAIIGSYEASEAITKHTLQDKFFKETLESNKQIQDPHQRLISDAAAFQLFHGDGKNLAQNQAAVALLGKTAKEGRSPTPEEWEALQRNFSLLGRGGGSPATVALQAFIAETQEREGRPPTSEEITEFQKKFRGGAALDDATLNSMADQAIAGDSSVFTNLGRGAQGAENVVRLRKRIADKLAAQGKTGGEQAINQAQYQGLRAAERTAGTREATVGIAAYEAKNMMGIAREASEKVSRTKFVPVNQAIQALERGVSNPELAKFVAANNSLVNGYVRAISPTGVPTDIVRKHAWDMLNTAQSKEAYSAVLDTMESEMNAAIVAPEQMKQQLLKRGALPGETDFKNLGTPKTQSLEHPGWSIEKL